MDLIKQVSNEDKDGKIIYLQILNIQNFNNNNKKNYSNYLFKKAKNGFKYQLKFLADLKII